MTVDIPTASEHLRPTAGAESWWGHYREAVSGTFTATALDVLDADCTYIVERCLASPQDAARWPESRVRRGLVMGAVQSGKTASMIGVAAKSLDAGTDLVLVLSGTRTALWLQTFQRLAQQLDFEGQDAALIPRRRWIPSPDQDMEHLASAGLGGYRLNKARARLAVNEGVPLVVVAMKNVDHLRALAHTLHDNLMPAIDAAERPFHMLVIDDEADDGSVLDARGETRHEGTTKQIPRYILDLWDSRPHGGATASEHLYVTYTAYTATPQANFLQEEFNPLAPREFVMALRTPGPLGQLEPREPTYAEPGGVSKWYIGGDFFYERLSTAPLCLDSTSWSSHGEALDAALKCFLMAAAVRLWRKEPEIIGPTTAKGCVFPSRAEAKRRVVPVSSMLIHPSAAKEEHFRLAAEVLGWAARTDRADGESRYRTGERHLDLAGLLSSLEEDEDSWQSWLPAFRETARALAHETGSLRVRHVPGREDWEEIRTLLIREIFPAARIAVINSDEKADDRPRFDPEPVADGWRAASDALTIFVSGSVMSRGLTLEGLLTTYFSRRTEAPLADTQMQMQRWFGYRGEHVDLCRVFLTDDQLDLFRTYHQNDEALRRQVLTLMDDDEPPRLQVLQGLSHAATGKIAGLRSMPLSPAPHPFFPLSMGAGSNDPFAAQLVELFLQRGFTTLPSEEHPRGVLLNDTLDLGEAARLLDGVRFDGYEPGLGGWEESRWESARRQLEAPGVVGAPLLYRPPGGEGGDEARPACPYSLAAYLRFWEACLTRWVPGLFPTDDPRTPWSLLDLEEKRATAPRFRVALRLGSGEPVSEGPLVRLGVPLPRMMRDMDRSGTLRSHWGSHNPGSREATGDEFFDLIELGEPRPNTTAGARPWRPVGSPGLLLFHLVDRWGAPGLVLGASIPMGGPNQFAAYVPEER